MIGSRRDLGLGRDHVQERAHRLLALEQVGVHVHVEQVRAAAHLLERDLDGRAEVAASIRRRKRAEPVTFVRSPIRTKPVSGPISNGSSPLKRGARAGGTTACGASRAPRRRSRPCARGRAAAAAGDVQQAVVRELPEQREVTSGVSS